mmetsp:Transcript_43529/g.42011  ORF Transcript_43529/g.42011 Transcript_43529/m.42011 type:complete len:99 (-) Transcript_43529:178-474(-)
MKLQNLHKVDINSVDWSNCDSNYVVTGSTDKNVHIVDIRKTGSDSVVRKLSYHQNSINVVKFSPFSKDFVASSGDKLLIWDLKDQEDALLFNHAEHLG